MDSICSVGINNWGLVDRFYRKTVMVVIDMGRDIDVFISLMAVTGVLSSG